MKKSVTLTAGNTAEALECLRNHGAVRCGNRLAHAVMADEVHLCSVPDGESYALLHFDAEGTLWRECVKRTPEECLAFLLGAGYLKEI